MSDIGEMGAVEKEERVVRAWKNKAKGKPMRWRILRDIVACLSLDWMSTFQVQIAMRRLYALKNKTTRDILEELEGEKSIQQSFSPEEVYKWEATKEGVAFWVGQTSRIPVSVASVALNSASVNE